MRASAQHDLAGTYAVHTTTNLTFGRLIGQVFGTALSDRHKIMVVIAGRGRTRQQQYVVHR